MSGTKSKPVVIYNEFGGFFETLSGENIAVLYGVLGHPNLGNCPKVYTSVVEKINYDESGHNILGFTTKNTVYVKNTLAACTRYVTKHDLVKQEPSA